MIWYKNIEGKNDFTPDLFTAFARTSLSNIQCFKMSFFNNDCR